MSYNFQYTKDQFTRFKQDYEVYGTHEVVDQYRNKTREKDTTPRGTINCMWQPATDNVSLAEYGRSVSSIYFAIIYDDLPIEHGDVITVRGKECEVISIKEFNTYRRVDVKRKQGVANG